MLAANIYRSYTALLMAVIQRVPKAMEDLDRMRDPKPGDVVVEISTSWHTDWPGQGIGVLIERQGPDPEDRWETDVWVIKSFLGDEPVTSWQNASFIAGSYDAFHDWFEASPSVVSYGSVVSSGKETDDPS